MNYITIFLFITLIGSFFSLSAVYGELEGTKMVCDELGLPISENQKSCVFPTLVQPELGNSEYEIRLVFHWIYFMAIIVQEFIRTNI